VKQIRPLLDRTDLKNLQYLGLKNSEFADEIAKALVGAKVLKGLKTLDLTKSTLTDEGAKALVAAKDSLAHLECLDLSENFLTKAGAKMVKGICKKVIVDGQQEPDDWDDEPHYFCQITE
jgi:Ran GTPase-activating protein (RanGAP) involved in mRNA processing and transport